MLEGALEKLAAAAGDPAEYTLVTRADHGSARLALTALVGGSLCIDYLERISCSHCGEPTPKSYGGGYCYGCFTTLARCDLCVVSPERCHFAAGTCREPEWGEAFCMQPHLVYLANSSAPKVGLTRPGAEIGRWLDQGATQGMVLAAAPTRHLAGVLEAALARRVSDRTDWRALLRGDAPPADLPALGERLRAGLDALPPGVRWLSGEPVHALRYPVLEYPRKPARLRLDRDRRIAGRLVGIKGQYLLFEHGVLSVQAHRGFHVRVRSADDGAAFPAEPPADSSDDSQMELFS